MSDARWLDVDDDVASAATHFRNAQALYAAGRFDDPGLDGYRDGMALMHALQAAHTSAENALRRPRLTPIRLRASRNAWSMPSRTQSD